MEVWGKGGGREGKGSGNGKRWSEGIAEAGNSMIRGSGKRRQTAGEERRNMGLGVERVQGQCGRHWGAI